MPTRLIGVVVDAAEPARLAGFWAAALGWQITVDEPDEVVVETGSGIEWGDGGAPCLTFVPVPEPKAGKNRLHLDLAAADLPAQREAVDRLLGLGARRVDIGQGPVPWVVLADPEGNELCVLEPRADYAGVDRVAAVALDCRDPQGLAGFWLAATGWPPVDASPELVTLRHPDAAGATRLELLATNEPKQDMNRLHLDLAPHPGGQPAAEVARLEAAGARRVDVGQRGVFRVVLADPEGNELCVRTIPR